MSKRPLSTMTEVANLVAKTSVLPFDVPDFHNGQLIGEGKVSTPGKTLMTFFKGVLETVDWDAGNYGMSSGQRKRFKDAAQLAACHAMLNRLRPGVKRLQVEATTAGVDLPTFTRQLLITITRAYAQLFTLQLFGILPLNQPTGRLNFKDFQYDTAFNGTVANPTPTINQGDRMDDITKFNPDYYAATEGAQANKIKFHYSNLDISVKDYRVIAEWTDQLADDAMSVFDDDAERSVMEQMAQESARVVDRNMINAARTNAPSYNAVTWTGVPTGTGGLPNYATLSPSEQRVYDEKLFSVAIQTCVNKIRTTRRYNNDGNPDWMVCDPLFSLKLLQSQAFRPLDRGREIDMQTGALRDLGDLTSLGIRVLVDPLFTANTALLGRKPASKNDVGIYWAPYVNLQPTRDLYDPETGTTTKGVRSRFAIAQPNTGVNPASSQLADIYGTVTII